MITTILCTANRPDQLATALAGLSQQTVPNRVIIFDNGLVSCTSNPNVGRAMSLLSHKGWAVRMERVPHCDIATLRQRGLDESDTPFVFYTDDDGYLEPNALEELCATFKAHPTVGFIQGCVVDVENTRHYTDWTIDAPAGHGEPRHFYRYAKKYEVPTLAMDTCNCLIDRQKAVSVGGFQVGRVGTQDISGEDTVLGIMLTYHFKAMLNTAAMSWHFAGPSRWNEMKTRHKLAQNVARALGVSEAHIQVCQQAF